MPHYPEEIEYSEKYADDRYEYRHVLLTKPIAKDMYKLTGGQRLLLEEEWRFLGVQQSRGWAHYEIHRPEPHILLFRRQLGTDPTTGKVPDSLQGQVSEDILQAAISQLLDGPSGLQAAVGLAEAPARS